MRRYSLLADDNRHMQDLERRAIDTAKENAELLERMARLQDEISKRNAEAWRRLTPHEESDGASDDSIGTHLVSMMKSASSAFAVVRRRVSNRLDTLGGNTADAQERPTRGTTNSIFGLRQRLTAMRRASFQGRRGGSAIDLLSADGIPERINEEDWVKFSATSGLFFPGGTFKFRWDLFMLSLILYSAVTVPFRLAMDHAAEGGWWNLEVAISLCFLTDMVLTLQTAYLEGDQFILDRAMIRNNYLRGWFFLDFFSSLPLELIDVAVQAFSDGEDSGGSGLRMLRALRLVRLLRLLRLLKIQQYINLLEDALNINMAFISMVKLVLGLAYLTHIFGCAWYYLAASSHSETTWLSSYDDGSGATADVWVCYLYAVYWALTTLTTIGYGDIIPTNDGERGFALVVFLAGTLVFGYMISSVGDMVRNADPNAVKIDEKLDEVKVYLRWHKFKPELALRVRRYYEFYFSRKSAMDEDEIVRNLAPTLRRSVQAHLVHRTVMRIPLFHTDRTYVTLDLQLQAYHMLQPLLREAKESVTEAVDKNAGCGPSIYFARRGTFAAIGDLPDVVFYEIDASLKPGSLFGEHSLTSAGVCECHYRAKTRCELFAMAIDDLRKITSEIASHQRDEMAELIYAEYLDRKLARATVLRGVYSTAVAGMAMETSASASPEAAELLNALRLQSAFIGKRAQRLLDAPPKDSHLALALPGLYRPDYRAGDVASAAPTKPSTDERLAKMQAHLQHLDDRLRSLPSQADLQQAVVHAVSQAMERAQPPPPPQD